MLLRTILEAVGKSLADRHNSRAHSRSRSRGSSFSGRHINNDNNKSGTKTGMPLAYALARSWAWPALKFRCETHPEEVTQLSVDGMGETILHWTCLGKPPANTVKAILEVCPEMAQVRNSVGHLPLHVAISYRASEEVIRSLVEAFPESAGIPNGVGLYPLHLLCDIGCSVDSLRAVLETKAGAISITKRAARLSNLSPLAVLHARMNFNQFKRALASMREARNRQQTIRADQKRQQHEGNQLEEANTSSNVECSTASASSDAPQTCEHAKALLERNERMIASFQQNDYWQKAAMLVLVEYTQQPLSVCGLHDEQANIVHACAGVRFCPDSLLEFAMLLHMDDLFGKKDREGRLPLHVAAAHHARCLVQGIDEVGRSQRTMLQILRACPHAAYVKDVDDNLPFAVALQELRLAMQVRSENGNIYTSSRQGRFWSPAMHELMNANLSSLETLDLDERLYPHVWSKRITSPDALFQSIRRHPDLFRIR